MERFEVPRSGRLSVRGPDFDSVPPLAFPVFEVGEEELYLRRDSRLLLYVPPGSEVV